MWLPFLLLLVTVHCNRQQDDTIYLSGVVNQPVKTYTQKVSIASGTIINTTIWTAQELLLGDSVTLLLSPPTTVPLLTTLQKVTLSNTTLHIVLEKFGGHSLPVVTCLYDPENTLFRTTTLADGNNSTEKNCNLTLKNTEYTHDDNNNLATLWINYVPYCSDVCPVELEANIYLPMQLGGGVICAGVIISLCMAGLYGTRRSYLARINSIFGFLLSVCTVVTTAVILFEAHFYKLERDGWDCSQKNLLDDARFYTVLLAPSVFATATIFVAICWASFAFVLCCAPQKDDPKQAKSRIYLLTPKTRATVYFAFLALATAFLFGSVAGPFLAYFLEDPTKGSADLVIGAGVGIAAPLCIGFTLLSLTFGCTSMADSWLNSFKHPNAINLYQTLQTDTDWPTD